MANTKSRVWYREPWPWFLIFLPMTAVVASIITIWLAVKSDDGLVADDYYKQGLAINQTLDRDLAAQALGLKAQLSVADAALHIKLDGKLKAFPEFLRLRLVHPTQAGRDQEWQLQKSEPGSYMVVIKDTSGNQMLQNQRWQVILEPPVADWRLTGLWPAAARTISLGESEK
jgi:hypothetical protein